MSTAIFDITHSCLEQFDRAVAKHDSALLTHLIQSSDDGPPTKSTPCDFLGIRNSFLFWVDYTGALSLVDSSLDARLEGLADISAVVMELLEMVLRSLRRLDTIPEKTKPHPDAGTDDAAQSATGLYLARWVNACQAIESGLDELHFVALAIRKASAKRIDQMVTTSITPEDAVFRKNIVTLVRYRFPAARKALCQQLGESIADRRQIILQSKKHAKKLAVRRAPPSSTPVKAPTVKPKDAGPPLDPKVVARIVQEPSQVVSGMTKASRPDRKVLEVQHLQAPRPKALSTVISTISTSQEHSFEYPDVPKAKEGETRVQCPYCFAPLERSGSDKKSLDAWKRHIDEHTKPYSCLFPQCAKAMTFFTRRREWRAHMEANHSKDWLRKVHTMVWFCDIDHDEPLTFDTEASWKAHMKDLSSHPKRRLKVPTSVQLDALAPRKQQAALREPYVCPLCERIPQKVEPLIRKDGDDQIELRTQVIDHVADHLKSLALMALPSLQDTQSVPETSPESVELMGEDSQRELNEGSLARPPSGIDLIENASLPPSEWGGLTQDQMDICITSEPKWDPDVEIVPLAERAPEVLEPMWTGPWLSNTGPESEAVLANDPVLAAFMLAWRDPIYMFTQLHEAAEKGDVDLIRQLLKLGSDIEAAPDNSFTPLCAAAMHGQLEASQVLLEAGANVDAGVEHVHTITPLVLACQNGHLHIVRQLLHAGARLGARDHQGRTALVVAAGGFHEEIVRLLLDFGAHANWGYDLTEINAHHEGDSMSALMAAADSGHIKIVDLLLDKGADMHVRDNAGKTALIWAAEKGHLDVTQRLLERGANPNARDKDRNSALHQAVDSICEEESVAAVVEALLRFGGDVDAITHSGETAILRASGHKLWRVVNILLEHGANVRQVDTAGRGVLFAAITVATDHDHPGPGYRVKEGEQAAWDWDAMRSLLNAGAEIEPSVENARLPLVQAAFQGDERMVDLLQSYGAQVDRRDAGFHSGFTPLLAAALGGHPEVVTILFGRGARINEPDMAGNSALSVALFRYLCAGADRAASYREVAVRLLDLGANPNSLRTWRNPSEVSAEIVAAETEAGLAIDSPDFPDRLRPYFTTQRCLKCSRGGGCEASADGSCFIYPEPLACAASMGDVELVQTLIEKDADVNAWSKLSHGEMVTALVEAAKAGSEAIVKILLNLGADVNAYDPRGIAYPAIIHAAAARSAGILQLLLQAGAKVENLAGKGESALTEAVASGNSEAASFLIDQGFSLDHRLPDGRTPLMLAAMRDDLFTVQNLLRAGVDPRLELLDGQTAMSMAEQQDLSDLLKAYSMNAHIPDLKERKQAVLWTAVELGSPYVARDVLEDGADIRGKDENGETVLHCAVRKTPKQALESMIEFLLREGVPLDGLNESTIPLMSCAVEQVAAQGHAYALRALAKAGLDASVVLTAVQKAVLVDPPMTLRSLLKRGLDPNLKTGSATFSALWLATSFEDKEKLIVLLRAGTHLDDGLDQFLPLHEAARLNNIDMIELLLEAGADPDQRGNKDRSPLELCSLRGNHKAVSLLLKSKSVISPEALTLAVRNGHLKVIELLLAGGVDVNGRDKEGWTPLHYAASRETSEVLALLLSAGADVHAKGTDSSDDEDGSAGNTPLHAAAWEGRSQTTKLLLDSGADPNVEGRYFKTPLQLCAQGNHVDVAELLINAHADMNARGGDTRPALSTAAYHNCPEMVRLLLASGVEVNPDKQLDIFTLLFWVADHEHHDVALFLRLANCIYSADDKPQGSAIEWLETHGHDRVLQFIRDADGEGFDPGIITHPGLRARLNRLDKFDETEEGWFERALKYYGQDLRQSGCSCMVPECGKVFDEEYMWQDHIEVEHQQWKSDLKAQVRQDFQSWQQGRLVQSVWNEDMDMLRRLIGEVSDLDLSDKHGDTALGTAARTGNSEAASLLLEAGADPEAVSDQRSHEARWQPLGICAYHNQLAVGKLLIEAGAKPHPWSNPDALGVCAEEGHVEFATMLIDAGHEVVEFESSTWSLLSIPLEQNDSEMMRLLLASLPPQRDNDCAEDVMLWTAENDYPDIAAYLRLQGGAGFRPEPEAIQMAESKGHDRVLRILRDNDFGEEGTDIIEHRRLREQLVAEGQLLSVRTGVDKVVQLVEAARVSNFAVLDRLLDSGVDPASQDKDGNTALGQAIKHNRLAMVLHLIWSRGVNDSHYEAYLQSAQQSGKTSLVHALQGMGKHSEDEPGLSRPVGELAYAIFCNDEIMVKRLLRDECSFEDCTEAFIHAVENGFRVVPFVVSEINVNTMFEGTSAIQAAIRRLDQPDMVRLLLANGAIDTDGTILDWAVRHQHMDIVKFLCMTADKDEERLGAAMRAVELDSDEVADVKRCVLEGVPIDDDRIEHAAMKEYLMQTGKVRISEEFVQTQAERAMGDLIQAVQEQDLEEVKALLEAGSDLSILDTDYPPLTEAVRVGAPSIVAALLGAGADPSGVRHYRRLTPLAICALYDRAEEARLLLEAGADPDGERMWPDQEIVRPLQCCAARGHVDVARLLINAGASPSMEGRTFEEDRASLNHYDQVSSPLRSAVSNHRLDIVRLLLGAGAEVEADDNLLPWAARCNILDVAAFAFVSFGSEHLESDLASEIAQIMDHQRMLEILGGVCSRAEAGELITDQNMRARAGLAPLTSAMASSNAQDNNTDTNSEEGDHGLSTKATQKLFAAVWKGSLHEVDVLLQSGLDPNKPFAELHALEEAVNADNVEAVRLLLAAGATEPLTKVTMWAVERNYLDIAAFACVLASAGQGRVELDQARLAGYKSEVIEMLETLLVCEVVVHYRYLFEHKGMRARLVQLGKLKLRQRDRGPGPKFRAWSSASYELDSGSQEDGMKADLEDAIPRSPSDDEGPQWDVSDESEYEEDEDDLVSEEEEESDGGGRAKTAVSRSGSAQESEHDNGGEREEQGSDLSSSEAASASDNESDNNGEGHGTGVPRVPLPWPRKSALKKGPSK